MYFIVFFFCKRCQWVSKCFQDLPYRIIIDYISRYCCIQRYFTNKFHNVANCKIGTFSNYFIVVYNALTWHTFH